MKKATFFRLNIICVFYCFSASLAYAGNNNHAVISNQKDTTNLQIQSNPPILQTQKKTLRSTATAHGFSIFSIAQASVTPPAEISLVTWNGNIWSPIKGAGGVNSYVQNNIVFYRNVQVTLQCPMGSSEIEASVYGTYGSTAPQATQTRRFTNPVAGENMVSATTQWTVPLATGAALWDNFCQKANCQTISNPLVVEISCLSNGAVMSKKSTTIPYSMKVSCCAEPMGVSPKSNACWDRI